MRALLATTSGTDPLAQRDRAILLVAWETGMRTGDLVGLDVDDVDLRTGVVRVQQLPRASGTAR